MNFANIYPDGHGVSNLNQIRSMKTAPLSIRRSDPFWMYHADLFPPVPITKMLNTKSSIRTVLTLALASFAICSQARNDRLLMPISESFRWPSYKSILGADVAFQFGSSLPEPLKGPSIPTGEEVIAYGVASTVRPQGSAKKSETQTCRDAYRDALLKLSEKTFGRGDNAIVGIVSYYRDSPMDSATDYECHAGLTRAEVVLKGRSVKLELVLVRSLQAIALPGTSLPISTINPDTANTKLDVMDESLIPHATDKTRAGYREFLRRSFPKAFAISDQGAWGWAAGMGVADPDEPSDPKDRAVRGCEKHASSPCKLYAVDGRIIYEFDAPR